MRALFILLAAVLVTQLTPRTTTFAAEPYTMYAELSQTGQGAFIGKGAETALRAAEDLINSTGGIHGRPVHFVIADDETNPSSAIQIFNNIVAKNPAVIFGPNLAATCLAVMPLVKTQVIDYCLSPNPHPQPGGYSFVALPSTGDLVISALRYYHSRGIRKLATLNTTDASGQDGDNVIKDDLLMPEFKDMQVVDVEHFGVTDLTVSAQIERIKASGAQGVISWIPGTPFGTVCRGASDAGLSIPLVTSAGNVSYAEMAQYKAFLPKETYFVALRFMGTGLPEAPAVRKAQDAFYKAMQETHVKPDTLNAIAWDAVLIVVDALRHLPDGANAQAIHDYIEQQRAFPGIDGLMNFHDGSQRGAGPDSALVVRYDVESSQFIPVSKPGGRPL